VRKILFLLGVVFILSGCATYKFQEGTKPPFDKGYVASYEGDIIPEYTIGKDKSFPPDLSLAKERFNRRRLTVEKYYKDMGYIENRVKEVFWEPPVMIFNIFIGIFKLPYIAYSDYKYENDPKYREMITNRDEDEYQKEKARITSLKEELSKYIQKDLSQEVITAVPEQEKKAPEPAPIVTQPQPVAENKTETPKTVEKEGAPPKAEVKAPEAAAPEKVEKETASPKEEIKTQEVLPIEKQEKVEDKIEAPEPAVVRQAPVTTEFPSPVAVIISRPTKGFSPLRVDFYGTKSYSPNGRIVSYDWDFGDGDTSNKPKASNTYWSTTYGVRNFIVTLTVKDVKGATATATQVIEVMNK